MKCWWYNFCSINQYVKFLLLKDFKWSVLNIVKLIRTFCRYSKSIQSSDPPRNKFNFWALHFVYQDPRFSFEFLTKVNFVYRQKRVQQKRNALIIIYSRYLERENNRLFDFKCNLIVSNCERICLKMLMLNWEQKKNSFCVLSK